MSLTELISYLQTLVPEHGHKTVYTEDIWFGPLKLSKLRVKHFQGQAGIITFQIENAPTPIGTGEVRILKDRDY